MAGNRRTLPGNCVNQSYNTRRDNNIAGDLVIVGAPNAVFFEPNQVVGLANKKCTLKFLHFNIRDPLPAGAVRWLHVYDESDPTQISLGCVPDMFSFKITANVAGVPDNDFIPFTPAIIQATDWKCPRCTNIEDADGKEDKSEDPRNKWLGRGFNNGIVVAISSAQSFSDVGVTAGEFFIDAEWRENMQ